MESALEIPESVMVSEIDVQNQFEEICPVKWTSKRLEISHNQAPSSLIDVSMAVYSNRIVFIASELHGAIGNWVLAKAGEIGANTGQDDLCDDNQVVSTRVIFGADEPWLHVMARRVATELNSSKSILCSFTIRDRSNVDNVNRILTRLVEYIRQLKNEQPRILIGQNY